MKHCRGSSNRGYARTLKEAARFVLDGAQPHITNDYVIGAYLALLMGIGWYHSRRQRNLREYALAGKHMSWLPIGLSLMAALNSGIDYMVIRIDPEHVLGLSK